MEVIGGFSFFFLRRRAEEEELTCFVHMLLLLPLEDLRAEFFLVRTLVACGGGGARFCERGGETGGKRRGAVGWSCGMDFWGGGVSRFCSKSESRCVSRLAKFLDLSALFVRPDSI